MSNSGSGFPERMVIEGVPRIGYHKHLSPFPGSLYACMEFLGTPCSYEYLMGVTGAAFRRLWRNDDGGNVDIMYFGSDPWHRAFRALGYSGIPISCSNKAEMILAIQTSIAKNVPVLAFGIVGPPECGIVAGYDRDGEVLIGYSYFQGQFVEGYYEQSDWYENANWAWDTGMIVIGDRIPIRPERKTLISTLKWIVELARTPRWADHACGLNAYDRWADDMLKDEDFPDNKDILGLRTMVHGDAVVMLIERHSGACYLRSMADTAPDIADELCAAADLYDQTAAFLPDIWMWDDNMGPEVGEALRDPALRLGISNSIREAKEKEEAAVEIIESVLVTQKEMHGSIKV